MTLIERLERRQEALTVQQVAELLRVSDKHIYEMTADGSLPAFHVGRSIRLDPQDIADWLRKKRPPEVESDLRKAQKHKNPKASQNGKQSASADHIWHNRVNSLEAAFAIDGSSSGKTAE